MDAGKLIHELELGAGMVTALLEGVSAEEARFKPTPETWSMLEVLCHLYDEEREDFRQRLDILLHRPADPWPPIRPAEWVAERDYNSREFDEMRRKWLEERQKSLAWLRGLENPAWEQSAATPWGATMKAADMFASWVAHDGLHIRQLIELRRARTENLTSPYFIGYAGDW